MYGDGVAGGGYQKVATLLHTKCNHLQHKLRFFLRGIVCALVKDFGWRGNPAPPEPNTHVQVRRGNEKAFYELGYLLSQPQEAKLLLNLRDKGGQGGS